MLLNVEFKKPTKQALDAAKALVKEEQEQGDKLRRFRLFLPLLFSPIYTASPPVSGSTMAWFRSMISKSAPRPPAENLTEFIHRNMGANDDAAVAALSAKEFASQVNFYYRAFTAPLINAHAQLKVSLTVDVS